MLPPQQTACRLDTINGDRLIGSSAAMHQLLQQISRAATESAHVLVSGEPGTGRETIARAIHAQSASNLGPFIKVDCAKNPSEDLERMLFASSGNRNRAGAERRSLERVGRLSHLYQSKGGTLFLQNVIDLPARTQLRLARVLRDREVVITDEGTHVELDHRVITAGDPSLDAAVHDGRMLSDLHRRLCVFRLEVPPLRDRREDIPELAEHLVSLLCAGANIPCKHLSEAAQSMLTALPWRGNGNELQKLLEVLILRI